MITGTYRLVLDFFTILFLYALLKNTNVQDMVPALGFNQVRLCIECNVETRLWGIYLMACTV